jgi:gliding motility-associated-like protein
MDRFIGLLLATLFPVGACLAQFSATGGTSGTPYVFQPETGDNTGLDKVFVFNGTTNATLLYTTGTPSDWTWYRYEKNPDMAVAIPASDIQTTLTETVLSNVDGGYGYFIQSSGGLRHYAFVMTYLPATIDGITFTTEGDVCTNLTLQVSASVDELVYYTTKGLKKKLDRQFTLSWNTQEWNATEKAYDTKAMTSTTTNLSYNWTVTAPLCDTYFTVSGDQYATFFGTAVRYQSALYTAVAVETNATAVIQERSADNELDKVSSTEELSGSAPLIVDFSSNPSSAVINNLWYFYDSSDGTGAYKALYNEEDLTHTFQESGTFLVKLYVYDSNNTCQDSATFSPVISESSLDCPNFFTPRSSPGENDEFRVAYKSIISFKGIILNRWGNVLFEWTDPAKGWNGTYKGKAVSPGVYFYLIEAKGSDGLKYKKKGDINLLE